MDCAEVRVSRDRATAAGVHPIVTSKNADGTIPSRVMRTG